MTKILIVDDANLVRATIKKYLNESGAYTIVEATNGDEAIELYKATKPDIVTMDVTMDYKNGVDASREILKIDSNARIIMITALGQEDMLQECMQLGVKDFIVKPFTRERVISAISKTLEK